jgi:hypothetical protein
VPPGFPVFAVDNLTVETSGCQAQSEGANFLYISRATPYTQYMSIFQAKMLSG